MRHGGVIDVRERPRIPGCDGSLSLIVENRILGTSEIRLVTNLKLTGWRYGHLLRPLMREQDIKDYHNLSILVLMKLPDIESNLPRKWIVMSMKKTDYKCSSTVTYYRIKH